MAIGFEDSRQNRLRSERKAVELRERQTATARRQIGETTNDIKQSVLAKCSAINPKQRPGNEPSGGSAPVFEY